MATPLSSLKISAPLILVAALALGLTVFLNVGKLDRTLSQVEESRLRFTLNELRANLETGLDLGLPLTGLGNAQAALDSERRADPDIVAISVIDTAGTQIFTSGQAAANDGTVRLEATLKNNFGVPAGAVVLRYSGRKHKDVIALIGRQLSLAALFALVTTGLCFVIGIRLLVRPNGAGAR